MTLRVSALVCSKTPLSMSHFKASAIISMVLRFKAKSRVKQSYQKICMSNQIRNFQHLSIGTTAKLLQELCGNDLKIVWI